MKKIIITTICFVAAMFNLAMAQNQPQGIIAVDVGPGQLKALEGVQFQGKFTSVDAKTRKVVIQGPKGNQYETTVSEEIKNFDKIKVGDLVSLTIVKVLVSDVKVINDGIREREETQNYSNAAIGDKPSGTIENQVRIVADVRAIDAKKHIVTLRGPYKTVQVQLSPEVLKGIKVGNQIEAVITESISIKVTSPPIKK